MLTKAQTKLLILDIALMEAQSSDAPLTEKALNQVPNVDASSLMETLRKKLSLGASSIMETLNSNAPLMQQEEAGPS